MKYRVVLRRMNSTSQGLKLAKYISELFLIPEDKAYSYIKRAPLTLFDKIDETKLIEVESRLKELDADYEVLDLRKIESKKEKIANAKLNKMKQKKVPKIDESIPAPKIEVKKDEVSKLFHILLALVLLLFTTSFTVFIYFYSINSKDNQSAEKNEKALQMKSNDLHKKNSFSSSIKSKFHKLVSTEYNDSDVFTLIFQGKFEQSESILLEKFKKEGESQTLFKQLGILYFNWAFDEAKQDKWTDYGKNLDDLWNTDHVNRSLSYFEKALALDDSDFEVINYIGVIFYEKGWFDRAEKMYRLAVEKKPSYTEAVNNLGIMYNDLGELEKAEKQFEQVIQIDNNKKDAYLNLALVSQRLNKKAKAIFYLQTYIKFRPADENYLSAVQLLKKLEVQEGVEK